MEQGCRTQQTGANAEHAIEPAGHSPAAVFHYFHLSLLQSVEHCMTVRRSPAGQIGLTSHTYASRLLVMSTCSSSLCCGTDLLW